MMEKQFEEMVKIAEDALGSPKFESNCPETPCPYLNHKSVYCDTCVVLNALYDKGYRKQNDKGYRKQNYGEYHGSRFTDGAFYQEQCSVCGEWAYDYDKNYCPNCGARIKGGES